jgi:hypothetical protein
VRPAEGRAGLHRRVGGRGSTLGLVTAVDSYIRNDSLVDSLGCSTGARSLSSDCGTGESGSRRQDQSRSRVNGLAAGCDSLVACREVCHSQPSAEEGGLAVRHHSSRARHKRCDGRGHFDRDSVGQGNCAAICGCACRLDDDRRAGGRRVGRTSSNSASSRRTSLSVHRAGRTVKIRRVKGERLGVCVDEWVVSQAGCILGGASRHVGQVLGTASIVGGLAISGRTLLKLKFARECRSGSQQSDSREGGGGEVHLDCVSAIDSVLDIAGMMEL